MPCAGCKREVVATTPRVAAASSMSLHSAFAVSISTCRSLLNRLAWMTTEGNPDPGSAATAGPAVPPTPAAVPYWGSTLVLLAGTFVAVLDFVGRSVRGGRCLPLRAERSDRVHLRRSNRTLVRNAGAFDRAGHGARLPVAIQARNWCRHQDEPRAPEGTCCGLIQADLATACFRSALHPSWMRHLTFWPRGGKWSQFCQRWRHRPWCGQLRPVAGGHGP